MKAIISTKAGSPDVLELREIPIPIPKDNEILVKVHCASVTAGDAALRRFNRAVLSVVGLLAGFKPMIIPGVEFSGVIEATGMRVKSFQPGDEVRGTTTGLSKGANAEYVCVPETSRHGVLIRKSPHVTHREAAAATVGPMTAVQLLKKAGLKPGEMTLVYGASGSVGSAALHIAAHYGGAVDGVCSGTNIELVQSLGAEIVYDYKTVDFISSGKKYDVIFDAVGKLKKTDALKALKEKGRFVSVKSMTKEVKEELEFIQDLQVKGKLKPFIDKSYPLEEVKDAHILVDSGRKRGNIVISISGE
ncbi:NAD(P)-dependent alcohol dehydrogenase [Spirochaeta isovalerica]|uniref:NADPH:quinone reductase-like Zn-dependent oxidoreductase n=1 Tax=Spirochaeta isovalerica TaxID=150 RepID=A0A841RBG4_9SPIO|nr:NAD(P)-dependent alcohol dehydrogenase [Spirochaeta isovalerica]MBB6481273.1 NADPH:quinone reductase-like Zn-dependent oxidoreductase [Spirochaeta isovalerica]